MRTSPFMGQPHSTDQCRCLPNSQHLPESLTRRVVVRPFAPLSRGWPASPRNGGRLQFGTVAGTSWRSPICCSALLGCEHLPVGGSFDLSKSADGTHSKYSPPAASLPCSDVSCFAPMAFASRPKSRSTLSALR